MIAESVIIASRSRAKAMSFRKSSMTDASRGNVIRSLFSMARSRRRSITSSRVSTFLSARRIARNACLRALRTAASDSLATGFQPFHSSFEASQGIEVVPRGNDVIVAVAPLGNLVRLSCFTLCHRIEEVGSTRLSAPTPTFSCPL